MEASCKLYVADKASRRGSKGFAGKCLWRLQQGYVVSRCRLGEWLKIKTQYGLAEKSRSTAAGMIPAISMGIFGFDRHRFVC